MSQPAIVEATQTGNLLIVGAPGSGVTTALNEAVDAVRGPLVLIDPLYLGVDVHELFDRATVTAFDNGHDIDRGPCFDALLQVDEGVVVIDNYDFLVTETEGERYEEFLAVLLDLFTRDGVRLIATGLFWGDRPNVDIIPALGFDSVAFMFRDRDPVVVAASQSS